MKRPGAPPLDGKGQSEGACPVTQEPLRELQLDGLVGPTHNYAGLSHGNLASEHHQGLVSRPRRAALQGLEKMRLVHGLGVWQGLLPPHDRPSLSVLRQWGFAGKDEDVLARAAVAHDGRLLRLAASASAMWAANAATVAPACDTLDGRVHFVVANLAANTHRNLEPPTTERILRALFAHPASFMVHGPLPGGLFLGDEGAANHTRLATSAATVHLFGWGRQATPLPDAPTRFVARQSLEGSAAVARLLRLPDPQLLFARQHPEGIDAGSFHTDVLAVGQGRMLLLHEHAFVGADALAADLRRRLGDEACLRIVREAELPVAQAVAHYPFNSQLLPLPDGTLALLAPAECEQEEPCRTLLETLLAEENPITRVLYVDVRESMQNGGGPACLRLRVPLTETQRRAMEGRVLVNENLLREVEAWVTRHYRETLAPADLADPLLARETMTALDELTDILQVGSVYDFQRTSG